MRITDGVIALPLLPLLVVLAALDLDKIGLGWIARSEGASLYRSHHLCVIDGLDQEYPGNAVQHLVGNRRNARRRVNRPIQLWAQR